MSDGHPADDKMAFANDSIRREGEGAHDETISSEHDTAIHATPGHHGPWSNSGRIDGAGSVAPSVPHQPQLRLHDGDRGKPGHRTLCLSETSV